MRKTEEKKRPGTFENQSAHWSKQTKQNSGHLVSSFSVALPCDEDRFHLIACPPETPKEFRQCFASIWRPTQGGRVSQIVSVHLKFTPSVEWKWFLQYSLFPIFADYLTPALHLQLPRYDGCFLCVNLDFMKWSFALWPYMKKILSLQLSPTKNPSIYRYYSNCCNFAMVLLWHENRAEVSAYQPYQLRRLRSPTFVLEFIIHGWGTSWLCAVTLRDDWHLAFDFRSFLVWFCLLLITLIGCCGVFDDTRRWRFAGAFLITRWKWARGHWSVVGDARWRWRYMRRPLRWMRTAKFFKKMVSRLIFWLKLCVVWWRIAIWMQHRLSVALVLRFRHSKSSCVVRGQTWGSDDRLKGIRELSDGFVNYVVLLVSVLMCYCEWWEGERVPR